MAATLQRSTRSTEDDGEIVAREPLASRGGGDSVRGREAYKGDRHAARGVLEGVERRRGGAGSG